MKPKHLPLIAVILVLLLGMAPLQAEYIIGVDDVLEVVFWQVPELKQTVVVNAEGKITLSVAGEITAAGLTATQLGRKIVEHVSRFNRNVSQAVVTVRQYNANTVFVEGEVINPGRYAREVIPDMWTIIKEMGGVTQFGDLRTVKLIRGGKVDQGKVLTVDVLKAVTSKNLSELPGIYAHDIIRVGRLPAGVPSGGIPDQAGTRRNVFYVTGAVARPGAYSLEPGMDLLEAIAIAGGHVVTADLKDVRISSKIDQYSNVYKVNLDKQIKKGNVPRYLIQPEDAIIVVQRGGGIFGTGYAILRDVISVGGTITSIVLLVDRLSD